MTAFGPSTVHGRADEYTPPAPPPILPPDDNPGLIGGAAHLMPMDIDTSETAASGGDTADSLKQTWRQLISPAIPQDELPSLIEAIFSDRKTINMVGPLQESDAQAFIDAIDGVRHHVLDFRGIGLLTSPTFCC